MKFAFQRLFLATMLMTLLILPSGVSRSEPGSEVVVKKPAAPSQSVTSLHQWVVDRMLSWSPPGRSFIPDAKETPEDGKKRYSKIADSLINVVYDPNERPIFTGKYGRAKTLALIASMSWFESGYRRDVDMGLGRLGRGDGGRSWCMMQILLGKPAPGTTHSPKRVYLASGGFKLISSPKDPLWAKSYGGESLVKDRSACFRVGLHLARNSFRACGSLPIEDRLGVYGAGKCIPNWKPSRYRVRKAQNWLSAYKPPMKDADVLKLLHPAPIPTMSFPKEKGEGSISYLKPMYEDEKHIFRAFYR